MVYHFVKHIGFDIKADSLEQAKKIAKAIDECECDGIYSHIEDAVCDVMLDAIDDVLDADDDNYDDVYDNSVVHAGETEYVGYTEDADDPEERLYDYLTDADDEDEEDEDYVATSLYENEKKISEEAYLEALAPIILSCLISSVWSI